MVTQVLVLFGGPVDATDAGETGLYSLTTTRKRGEAAARHARAIKLLSAVYDAADDTVILTPSRPFASSQRVELRIGGGAPTTLEGSPGRHDSGHVKGRVGKSAIVLTSRRTPRAWPCPWGRPEAREATTPASVDALLERDQLVGLTTSFKAKHGRLAEHRRE